MSSNPSSRSPPTPTAPFLGPIELPYISGSSGSSRDNHYQLSQNSHRRPYAPLFVTLGSPVPVNTSAVGTAGALAGYAGGNGSVSGSTGSGSARQSNVYTCTPNIFLYYYTLAHYSRRHSYRWSCNPSDFSNTHAHPPPPHFPNRFRKYNLQHTQRTDIHRSKRNTRTFPIHNTS